MAHKEQLEFIATVKSSFPESFVGKRVLEIGSMDINGSIRSQFKNCSYVGMDIGPGPGVDLVCRGEEFAAPDDSFDTVISCEVMEHNPHWADTLRNMIRVCKPGGLVIMTCATLGRREHGTVRTETTPLLTATYYRNLTARDFRKQDATQGLTCIFVSNWRSCDLYMVGIKGTTREIENLHAIQEKYRRLFWSKWSSVRRALKANLLNRRN